MAAKNDGRALEQFDNPSNPRFTNDHGDRDHRDTGGRLDAVVAGVGTGGTVTGIGE